MFTLVGGKAPATSFLRHVMPLAVGALCLWILQGQISSDTFAGLGTALANLTSAQWISAGLATAVSFWALGRYDLILHRHLRTDCSPRQACASGAAAIAIGQTIGLGVLSGALVRWRLVPDLSLAQATKIATGVAVSFLLGLVLCLGLIGVLFPSDVLSFHQGLFCLFLFCSFGLLCFLYPTFRLGRAILRGPSLRMLGGIASLTLIDTFCAGVALWCLMPSDTALPLLALMPAYMLALGAALLSGTPGGVGPFELVLLAALPGIPQAELLCGIVAFRLIYYAIPFSLAALLLLRPFAPLAHSDICRRNLHERDLRKAPRAEIGLCRQADAGVIASRHVSLPVLRPGQSLCLLFAALGGAPEAALATLKKQAHREMLFPIVYKADGRMTAVATKSGWRALHVADDLVLKPSEFQTEGRAYRQLRRKLRQAEQAGLSIERGTALPWKELAQVDADWQARQGRARGMTMGQFCPEYLSHQDVFLARLKGRVVAFASFHVSTDEWCLDLMRANAPVPDGTMHALITAAIAAANEAGVPRFCLAALPPERGLIAWLAAKSGCSTGLSQFKKSFNPKRSPRYALAPSWVQLAIGLGDLLRAVRRPNRNLAHNHHENNEFARARGV